MELNNDQARELGQLLDDLVSGRPPQINSAGVQRWITYLNPPPVRVGDAVTRHSFGDFVYIVAGVRDAIGVAWIYPAEDPEGLGLVTPLNELRFIPPTNPVAAETDTRPVEGYGPIGTAFTPEEFVERFGPGGLNAFGQSFESGPPSYPQQGVV